MTGSSGLLFERVRVVVEDVGPEEDQQVAGDVDDEIEEKSEAGDADEELRADRRVEKTPACRDDAINRCSLLLRR